MNDHGSTFPSMSPVALPADGPGVADDGQSKQLVAFCARVVLFGCVLASSFLLLLVAQMIIMSNFAHDDRLGSVTDKHRRLQELASPRLILVGGSNLAYGVNSERLAQLTGRNVVNMSVQGSLGARFMIAEVAENLRAGDVVYVALEYEHFFRLPVDGESTLLRLLTVNPELFRYVTPAQIAKLVPVVPEVLKENAESLAFQVINPLRKRPNLRFQFDQYGDFVGHKDRAGPPLRLGRPARDWHLQHELVPLLADFERKASVAGARVVFGYPSVAQSLASQSMVTQVESALAGMKVAGRPADFTYPDSYFYDTGYHLLYAHRDERTDRLASDLMRALVSH
jgi:hypothetical protein